ncbi:MAG: hypothetical protein HPY85_11915 [Anaerolineae bacterium]|nr:hypothetical protein [Anaerolineae bacterium]
MYPNTITPLHLEQWRNTLTRLSQQPMEFAPGFPGIAQRFEAWWQHDCLDRPIFIASCNGNPQRPTARRVDLLKTPDRWFEEKFKDMRQTHWVGDALPFIRVDFGPVFMTALAGAEPIFVSDTTWYEHTINDDWSNAPDWRFRDDNPWQVLLRQLLAMVADDARGRYFVCTPNLGGTDEVLLNLRGSAKLCMDAIDQPEKIIQAVQAIHPEWERMTALLYESILSRGAGLIQWQMLWSNQPYTLPSSDFNAMLGPRHFKQLFLPDIEQRARTVGRASFHLDGPDAARHIDALIACDALDVIQFTPGDGAAPARSYTEMFRNVQQAGKSLLIACTQADVLPLCQALDPKGLAFLVGGDFTVASLDAFFHEFCQFYGVTAGKES